MFITHTHTHSRGHRPPTSIHIQPSNSLTSLISGGVSQPVSQPSPLGRNYSHPQWDMIRPASGLLTRLSGVGRNPGDERGRLKIPRTPCDPAGGCRAEHHGRLALRWLPHRQWCGGVEMRMEIRVFTLLSCRLFQNCSSRTCSLCRSD